VDTALRAYELIIYRENKTSVLPLPDHNLDEL
jgi:hypothetical protein